MIRRLAIIGLGLMGGSLGLAARQRGLARWVVGSARRARTRRLAIERGAVDEAVASPVEAIAGADFVVVCLPILAIPGALAAGAPHLARGAVVTDVGSTKGELAERCAPILRPHHAAFVGSHPIAGSEETGMESARADLYTGALTVVTPTGRVDGATRAVTAFWRAMGCRVVTMTAARHDRLIAATSHLPHMVAAALVESVLGDVRSGAERLCGTGFRDCTRVAGGSPAMWHDILRTNRQAVGDALRNFEATIQRMIRQLDAGDFESLKTDLEHAQSRWIAFDRRWRDARAAAVARTHDA